MAAGTWSVPAGQERARGGPGGRGAARTPVRRRGGGGGWLRRTPARSGRPGGPPGDL
ncbi:hypothetical protein SFR_0580 [Streptomyces sp. FR-008]|nr:hypothetical protein SFR_0580 [Streptomyces sp. FR-008]